MKVLVLGDVIIDKYIYGTSDRLSPEAPVPVVKHLREVETLGGAGLVYENLKSLGVDVTLYEYDQPKSTKTRVMCDGHYITRIDNDYHANSNTILNDILSKDFQRYDYVILSDYAKGVLEKSHEIIEHINKFGCKVIVDPKDHYSLYEGAWLVKPNEKEFTELDFDLWPGNIVTTRAGDSVVAKINDKVYDVPVDNIEVADVTGAGDCFLAAFVYGLTKGYDHKRCLELAVKGATEAVKHTGTHILSKHDLEDKVIFTNGCFDILHLGHLRLLKHACSLGDKLIVAINSDASVKRLKGETRPINDQTKRKEALELLNIVDEVLIFDDDTPYSIIKKTQPDIIVKGGDYTVETVVGNDLAEVNIFPKVEGHSTTHIIKEME